MATGDGEVDPLIAAGRLAVKIAAGVAPADYAKPTPCDRWDVRGVLNAMVVKAELFAAAVHDPAPAKPEPWPDVLGGDPPAAVQIAVERVVAAYAEIDNDRLVMLPLGEAPWAIARGVVMVDLTLHAWDLATATGQPFDPPADLVAICLATAAAVVNQDLRDHGEFKAALVVTDDVSDLERLLAMTGRASSWVPST